MGFSVFAPRPTSGEAPHAPANTRTPSVLGRGAAAYGRKHEVAALLLWTLALFLILALATYRGDPAGSTQAPPTLPGAAIVGPVGEAAARGLVSLLGLVAWTLPLELCLLGIPLVRGRPSPLTPGRVAGDLLLVIVTAALVQVGGPGHMAFGTHPAGGLVGELFGELGQSLFSTAGSFSGRLRVSGPDLDWAGGVLVHRAGQADGADRGEARGVGGGRGARGRAGVGGGARAGARAQGGGACRERAAHRPVAEGRRAGGRAALRRRRSGGGARRRGASPGPTAATFEVGADRCEGSPRVDPAR